MKRTSLLLIIFIALTAGHAFASPIGPFFCAHFPVTPVPPHTQERNPPCNDCKASASPAYVATGSYGTAATDLSMPTAGLPLTVSRSYESTRARDSILGVGWTLSLAAHLYYASYLYTAPSTYSHEADIVLPDGSRYRFVEHADGT